MHAPKIPDVVLPDDHFRNIFGEVLSLPNRSNPKVDSQHGLLLLLCEVVLTAMSGNEANPALRQNEYFVPGDGIAPEVITAEICRYLGNDAVVRSGTGNINGRSIAGYCLKAYRNLTSVSYTPMKISLVEVVV